MSISKKSTKSKNKSKAKMSYWLTPTEAANFLDCSIVTIYRNLKRGKIPYKKFGQNYKIPSSFCVQLDNEV